MKVFIINLMFLSVLLLLCPAAASAQAAAASGYKLATEKSGVSIYYNDVKEGATDIQPLSVAFRNANPSAVEIEWIYHVWYNGNCRSCMVTEPDNFYHKKMILKPGSQKVINFNQPDKDGLVLYKKYKNSILTKLEFANLKVKLVKNDPALKKSDK